MPLSLGTDKADEALERRWTAVQELKSEAPAGAKKQLAGLEEVISAARSNPSQFETQTLIDAMIPVENWALANC